MISENKRAELRHNFEIFKRSVADLIREHENEYALMRHGEIVAFHDTASEALRAGRDDFADDMFSVQKVSTRAADFGWFSRAPIDERL